MPYLGSVSEVKFDKAVSKAVGDNPVGKKIKKDLKDDKDRSRRIDVFMAVSRLERAARDLYVDDGKSFDQVVGDLANALSNLKGKESELQKAAGKEKKDDEETVKKV